MGKLLDRTSIADSVQAQTPVDSHTALGFAINSYCPSPEKVHQVPIDVGSGQYCCCLGPVDLLGISDTALHWSRLSLLYYLLLLYMT